MKKKDYQKPAMIVVILQHRTMLLQASKTSATSNNSTLNVEYTEEDWVE